MINIILACIVSIVISYLIGSIPTGYLVGRAFKGVDIRQIGSHNMGAMNTFYTIGFWPGMLVLACDVGKGSVALLLTFLTASYLFPIPAYLVIPIEMVSGVAVIAGHVFPLFLKFRGGKGGATAIGVLAFIVPWINWVTIGTATIPIPAGDLVYLGSFLLLLAVTRWATAAYGVSFIVFPLVAWFGMHDQGLTIYSACIGMTPILMYIPRLKEILGKSEGNVKKAIFRKNIKDRM